MCVDDVLAHAATTETATTSPNPVRLPLIHSEYIEQRLRPVALRALLPFHFIPKESIMVWHSSVPLLIIFYFYTDASTSRSPAS